jgi:protein TonB
MPRRVRLRPHKKDAAKLHRFAGTAYNTAVASSSIALLLTAKKRSPVPPSTGRVAVGAGAVAREAARSSSDRLLWYAVAASVFAHGVLLPLSFKPAADKKPEGTPALEVVLVNSKSKSRPTKAEVLAQHNLEGGGNTDAAVRAKTPLPVLPNESMQADLSIASRKVESLESQARVMTAQLKAKPLLAAKNQRVEAPTPALEPNANELMQRTLEAIKLEAQIAKEQQAYAQRPKKRFIGSRAEEYRFARYVEDWRLKVERIGNLNYPDTARQQRLYGHLVLTVGINVDGSIESVQVDVPSGKKILDAAAVRIVQLAAPYAPFPADIRGDTDILYITRTWTFTRGDAFTSE